MIEVGVNNLERPCLITFYLYLPVVDGIKGVSLACEL